MEEKKEEEQKKTKTVSVFPDVNEVDAAMLLIVGRKQSGKTTLLVDLLYTFYANTFDLIVIVSPTFMNQDVAAEIDGQRGIVVVEDWDPRLLVGIGEALHKLEEREDEAYANEGLKSPKNVKRALLVLDDLGSMQYWTKAEKKEMEETTYLMRHRNISVFTLGQRLTLTLPGARSQADGLIIFGESNNLERNLLVQNFGFGNKEQFLHDFDERTKDEHSFGVLRNVKGKFRWTN